ELRDSSGAQSNTPRSAEGMSYGLGAVRSASAHYQTSHGTGHSTKAASNTPTITARIACLRLIPITARMICLRLMRHDDVMRERAQCLDELLQAHDAHAMRCAMRGGPTVSSSGCSRCFMYSTAPCPPRERPNWPSS